MNGDARDALRRFRRLYLDDEEADRPVPLEAYQARFPGFEPLIADEYARLREGSDEVHAPLEAFERAFRRDRARGEIRPLAEYLARFAGQDLALAERFAVLRLEAEVPERLVGPYRLIEELGRGGQGVVWRAEDTRLRRHVALKVLTGLTRTSEEPLRRFRREAEIASRLDHPGICTVHDTGNEGGFPYIAMRFVPGETLARRIAASREAGAACVQLPPLAGDATPAGPGGSPSTGRSARAELLRAARLVEQAARALHAAHEAGVLHRDVKPGNIMVTPEGEPVLLDFGLARALEEDLPTLTRTGDVFGTPAYMSPELVSGTTGVPDARIDVYSLGVTLFECLTLRRPYEAPTRQALEEAIRAAPVPDPRRLNPRIPRDLATVVMTAIEKEPHRRYARAADLAEDLRRVRALEPIAARAITPYGRLVRWARRQPARAALVALALVSALAVTALSGWIVAQRPSVRAQQARALEDEVERHLEEGFIEFEGGSPARLVEAFEAALRLRPDTVEAVAGLAQNHLRANQPQTALDLLDRHAGLARETRGLDRLRADALRNLGRTEEAARLEQTIPGPRTALDFYLAGFREVKQGDDQGTAGAFQRGRDLLAQAVVLSPRPRPVYYQQLAHAAGHMKDPTLAAPIARALAHFWPASAGARFWASFALMEIAPDQAMQELREAVRLQPRLGRGWINMGRLLLQQGRADEALAAFDRGAPHYLGDTRMLMDYAGLLAGKGRTDEAIAVMQKIVEARPDDPGAWGNLGTALAYRARWSEAVEPLRRSLALRPADPGVLINLAIALSKLKQFPESIELGRKAVTLQPGQATLHETLAAILRDAGEDEEAAGEQRRAAALKGRDPRPVNDVQRQMERAASDESELRELLEGSRPPASRPERLKAARLCARKALHASAARFWRDAFAQDPGLSRLGLGGARMEAAREAVLAGTGAGEEARALDEAARSGWRRQALDWLQVGLEAAKTGPPEEVRRDVAALMAEPAFERVREGLDRFPEPEREEWRRFWAAVGEVRGSR